MTLTKASYSLIQGTPLNLADYGVVGNGIADDTAAIQAAIDALGALGRGSLTGPNDVTYRITATLDFTILGAAHEPYEIDFKGATFLWGGSATSTDPMWYFYNNKQVTVKNFFLKGAAATPSDVTGIEVDSLQPDGADLLVFSNFRIQYCEYGIQLGSVTGGTQNRVSDSRFEQFVIENIGTAGIKTKSTNVDNIMLQNGIISAITTGDGVNLNRSGFVKFDSVSGFALLRFVNVDGPIGALTLIGCQAENGGVANNYSFYRSNYTLARQGSVTFVGCTLDDKVMFADPAPAAADQQFVNFIGGRFSDFEVECDNTIVNLMGCLGLTGGTVTFTGANIKCYQSGGTRLDGTVVDTADALSDTDVIMNPDNKIVQFGNLPAVTVAANTVQTESIVFPRPFPNGITAIIVGANSVGAGGDLLVYRDTNTTTLTGFDVNLQNLDSGGTRSIGADYIAYGF
jgi:hypothetical protein